MPILDGGGSAEATLEQLAEDYSESSNPLLAWDALYIALRHKLEVPRFAAKYFIECTEKLGGLLDQAPSRAGDVARLLGFAAPRGHASPFLRYSARQRDKSIAREFGSGYRKTEAKKALAKRHRVSVRQVERALADFSELVNEPSVTLVLTTTRPSSNRHVLRPKEHLREGDVHGHEVGGWEEHRGGA